MFLLFISAGTADSQCG